MEIARFLGIIISFCEDFAATGHVHVTYMHHNCVMGIDNTAVFNGSAPARVVGLVSEWLVINRAQLSANWEMHKLGNRNLPAIPPLVE